MGWTKCPGCEAERYEPRRPASPTDEDVERVAEVLRDTLVSSDAFYYVHPNNLARAALSAYLEPTTKGDT